MKFVKVILLSSCLMLALTGCDKIKSLIDSKGEAKEETTETVKKDTVVIIEKHYVNDGLAQPSAAPAPQSTVNAAAISDFAWLSNHRLSYGEIANYSQADLRILRNAIFARHGYRFKSQDLMTYFSQFSWYQPLYNDVTSQLSAIEQDNINFIKQYE